ncbi:hypothetical protein ATJ88_0052 [Isoptericola jiangsuensis]|uniref:Uncharacterized protein n=1 Tax=Isoptericola jiangsuensis TaxID=548579 RepID=A0A2A9EQP9_9MICO|nr:hypothetical protein ATJ88_0052 [Isoptericola jiangsuensis]
MVDNSVGLGQAVVHTCGQICGCLWNTPPYRWTNTR